MAKHNQQAAIVNGAFQFSDANIQEVESRVFSFKLKDASGHNVDVPKNLLKVMRNRKMTDGSIKEVEEYRYSMRRFVPKLVVNGDTLDDLVAGVADFYNNLQTYESAGEYMLPNGKVLPRKSSILTDGTKDAKPVSAVQYIVDCINEANVLRNNAAMQTILRAKAEPELRSEMGIEAPTGKQRTFTKAAGIEDDYDNIA